jgi:hypothetical protein
VSHRDGKFTSIHTFLAWQDGLDAAGLADS